MNAKRTTVHDVEDIANIYHDCNNWSVKFWNFTDQCYMKLQYLCDGFDEDHERVAWFAAGKVDKDSLRLDALSHLLGWKRWLKRTYNECNGDYKEKMDWDSAKIVVINARNMQRMHITFTGSSQDTKEISYSINYDDPKYRQWKRNLFWKWFNLKYNATKLWKQFTKLLGRKAPQDQ